jgi:hypothetical protein
MTEPFELLLLDQLHQSAAAIQAVVDHEMKERLAKAMLEYAESILPKKEEVAPAKNEAAAKHESVHDTLAKHDIEPRAGHTTHSSGVSSAWAEKHK